MSINKEGKMKIIDVSVYPTSRGKGLTDLGFDGIQMNTKD